MNSKKFRGINFSRVCRQRRTLEEVKEKLGLEGARRGKLQFFIKGEERERTCLQAEEEIRRRKREIRVGGGQGEGSFSL